MEPPPPSDQVGSPVTPEVVQRPPPARPRRRLRTWAVLLLLLVLLGLAGSATLNVVLLVARAPYNSRQVREKFYSHHRYGRQKIAILAVEGPILEAEGFVKRQIDQASKDEDLRAVVLRVDSPGGTVTASNYIYHHLCKLREESNIPMVVSMGGLAASGGYYISMAAGQTPETIFAEPTTWTGSIGVMIPLFNASKLMNEWGIEEDSVVSHPLKNMGSFAKPLTEEEHEIFQALVDESFSRFKEIVKSGRPKFRNNPEALDELATGQVFTAEQALQGGLIDRIGFLEDAIDRAIELAGLDEDQVRVVKYAPEPTLADILFGGMVRSHGFDPAALLDLTTPRAYYLWSRIPPLIQSGRR